MIFERWKVWKVCSNVYNIGTVKQFHLIIIQ